MAFEDFQVAGPANLSGALLSGGTSLCIYSGVTWPVNLSGSFRVTVDKEIIRLQGQSGFVFPIIQRGVEGTTEADHQDYAQTIHTITAQGLKNLTGGVNRQSGSAYTFGATDARACVLFHASGVAPVSGILPQTTSGDTSDFGPHYWTIAFNRSSGALNLAPESGTINGGTNLLLDGGANKAAFLFSDGTVAGNWAAIVTTMSGGGGASLTSGSVQSGHIASGAVQGFFGSTRNIASGTVGVSDFGSGAVVAGTVGSGAVGSGNVASGQLGPTHFSSGLLISVSGVGFTATTIETISGVRAIQIGPTGFVRIAMASISGRMPATGLVVDNVASGVGVFVYTDGTFQFSSGMADYSGYVGTALFVGRSGQIVSVNGSWNSGGFVYSSGDISQMIGVSKNSGGMLL